MLRLAIRSRACRGKGTDSESCCALSRYKQSVARGIMEICFDVPIEISFLEMPTCDRLVSHRPSGSRITSGLDSELHVCF
jgi:hypothetical protein